jgi:hypothetical protein
MRREAPDDVPRLLICGTGGFAFRLLLDIAAVATRPMRVIVAGRNRDRLTHLTTIANARAAAFGSPVEVSGVAADLNSDAAASELIGKIKPTVVIQAASTQAVSVLRSDGNAWTELVRDAGYSVTMVFQALITMRVAGAIGRISPETALFNCCFPDVVNSAVKAAGLPILSGVGNIAILSNILRGSLPVERREGLRMLAHYRNLGVWRTAPQLRKGIPPRVWLGEQEVADVYSAFADVRLTPEPVPDVSAGSAAAPVLAVLHRSDWKGHLPGCNGLPGGYPVTIEAGALALDLPADLAREEAIAWNASFEEAGGVVVLPDGHVRYTGKTHEALARQSLELANGFHISDIEDVWLSMSSFRDKMWSSNAVAG